MIHNFIKNIRIGSNIPWSGWYVPFVIASIVLSSCSSTRYLDSEKGEAFLTASQVKIIQPAGKKIKNISNLNFELSRQYLQKPNRRFFGVPRQYFYYTSLDTLRKTKLGKTFSKVQGNVLGEEPVLLDTTLANQTSAIMKNYLRNRGYFFADVNHVISFNRKETKAEVTYNVTPGGIFTIDSIEFVSKDTAIQNLLKKISAETFLAKGQPIDIKLYDQEVARITFYLRNNGYAYFYPQYVSNLEGSDSSNVTNTSNLKLEVLPPPGAKAHKSYRVGNIYMNTYFDPSAEVLSEPDTLFDGINFARRNRTSRVRPRTLASSVFFRTGDLYSQEAVDNSIRQLGALGVFRPPTIRFEEDPLQPGVLNFQILLTPNKKWELGADFDINTVERKGAVGNRNLIGLSFSPSLRNRNFLKGAELLIGTVDMGVEFAPFGPDTSLINTLDLRVQADLYFPRFADYLKIWRGLRGVGLTSAKFYDQLRMKATSRFSSSYNLLVLLDNYSLQYVNVSYGYDLPIGQTGRLIFNHFGVDLVVPRIVGGSFFEKLLESQPFLQKSFSKQFITGMAFRDLTYVYQSKPSSGGDSWYLRSYFDVSGLEAMAVNSLVNVVSGNAPDFKFFDVDFSYYTKLELDGRRYWQFGPNKSLVARLNAGVAIPLYQSDAVPYIKQFFVGGPYSIRGWYARALGPGLYRDELSFDPSQRNLFYQSGDAKIEFNLEYRFLLMRPFGMFNLYGAWFVDAGNVWTLKKDPNRIGSNLAWTRELSENGIIQQDNFIKEIAVGAGFGTRWDFTYFVFRLDLGTPVRNNHPDALRNQSYWVDYKNWRFKDVVFNIGLGYPF